MSTATKWTDPFEDMSDEEFDDHVDALSRSGRGRAEDIEHHTLEALEGGKYGHVTHVMRRIDPVFVGFRRIVVRFPGLIVR